MQHVSTVTRRFAAIGLQLAERSTRPTPVQQRGLSILAQWPQRGGPAWISTPCSRFSPFARPVLSYNGVPSAKCFNATTTRTFASHVSPGKKPQPAKSTKVKPLRYGELSKILGPDLPRGAAGAAFGNELLQHIQEQRITGTLDKPLEHEQLTPAMVERGLAYLRKHYALDEEAAIVRRIELEEEGKYQRAVQWKPQQLAEGQSVYGAPKLDAIREENLALSAQREAEDAARREQELADTEVAYETQLVWHQGKMQRRVDEIHTADKGKGSRRIAATTYIPAEEDATEHVKRLSAGPETTPDGQTGAGGLVRAPNGYAVLRSRDERVAAEDKWWSKYERAARLTDWDGLSEAPRMPLWRRLGLPTLFAAAVLVVCYGFSKVYEPPVKDARLFPDIPPAAATIYTLLAANALVFVMWRLPPLWRFMNKNFLMHAVIPAPQQLLGAVFSHQQVLHLAWNMFLLWNIGTSLCDQIGRGNFLATYFGAGVFSSWVSLVHFVVAKRFRESSLGASGALSGILFCYLLLNSGKRFEIPIPGEGNKKLYFSTDSFLYMLIALELFGLVMSKVRRVPTKIDHFSHIGGFVAGWGAAQLLKQQAKEKPEKRRFVSSLERPRSW